MVMESNPCRRKVGVLGILDGLTEKGMALLASLLAQSDALVALYTPMERVMNKAGRKDIFYHDIPEYPLGIIDTCLEFFAERDVIRAIQILDAVYGPQSNHERDAVQVKIEKTVFESPVPSGEVLLSNDEALSVLIGHLPRLVEECEVKHMLLSKDEAASAIIENPRLIDDADETTLSSIRNYCLVLGKLDKAFRALQQRPGLTDEEVITAFVEKGSVAASTVKILADAYISAHGLSEDKVTSAVVKGLRTIAKDGFNDLHDIYYTCKICDFDEVVETFKINRKDMGEPLVLDIIKGIAKSTARTLSPPLSQFRTVAKFIDGYSELKEVFLAATDCAPKESDSEALVHALIENGFEPDRAREFAASYCMIDAGIHSAIDS